MGQVIILPYTTKHPLEMMGRCAGICWGANIEDEAKNIKRGIDCIESDHGRPMEYPDIYSKLEGYSARVIREWYTHIGGAPTRLQASTRYINYNDFSYYVPPKIANNLNAMILYEDTMKLIANRSKRLEEEIGIPREDVANLYPLGMNTVVVDKRNSRNVMDMSRQRTCIRAYHEFRDLFDDYLTALASYSEEWDTLIKKTMMPKCEVLGYCPEKRGCGRMPQKERP